MNRQFKFRAWDKSQNVMIYKSDLITNPFSKCLMLALEGGLIDMTCDRQEDESNNCVLMQYTGLKDRNGKEIYEGDIVKHRELNKPGDNLLYDLAFSINKKPLVVEYRFYAFYPLSSFVSNDNLKWEIIGNIYQNPELLNA